MRGFELETLQTQARQTMVPPEPPWPPLITYPSLVRDLSTALNLPLIQISFHKEYRISYRYTPNIWEKNMDPKSRNYANITERCDALTRAIVLPPSPLKPHAATHTKNPQKVIIRISSPAEDFSKIKFINPPCFLRP